MKTAELVCCLFCLPLGLIHYRIWRRGFSATIKEVIVTALLCGSMFLLMRDAEGFEQGTDPLNSAALLHWNSTDIPYQFDKRAPREFRAAVEGCLKEWTEATGIIFVRGPDVSSTEVGGITFVYATRPNIDAINSINGGSTTYTTDRNGLISGARVALNGRFYKWHRGAPTMIKKDGRVWNWSFDFILLHEIGHALGLAHNNLIDSVMYGKPGHLFVSSDDANGARKAAGQ